MTLRGGRDIQSARLSVQSSELGPTNSPPPHPQACVAPHLDGGGGADTLACEGWNGGPSSDEGTDNLVFCVNYNPSTQGVTKRCRLSWLNNSAFVYEPKCGGGGGCGVPANEYSCAHRAQINLGDLTRYLTYASTKK